jgi:hypothetical protein
MPSSTSDLHSERFEFSLRRVDIGVADDFTVHPPGAEPFSIGSSCIRDSISFTLGGHPWRLRRLVSYEGDCLPADTAYYHAAQKGERFQGDLKLKHAMLEIPTRAIKQSEAAEMAFDIGWLLGLALGQRVTWCEVGIRKNHFRRIVKARNVSLPQEASVQQPLSNQGERQLGKFLETAYPVFCEDKEWWEITLHWFALACESSTVEVSGMIYSMLLERISSRVLEGHSFGKLIGVDLDVCLSDPTRKAALAKNLTKVLQQPAASWTETHSHRLIQKIKEWNDAPSYPKKIATVFSEVGLQPPSKMVTDARHTLMHAGNLPETTRKEIRAYHRDVHQSIVVLLLAMLGHDGWLFIPDRGMCSMKQFKIDGTWPGETVS